MTTLTINATFTIRATTTTTLKTRSAKATLTGKRSTSLTVRSAQKKEEEGNAVNAVATGVAATVLTSGGEARASELTEKLASFLDAVDAASETVASGVNQGVEIANKAKEAYDEAVPVVTPYAERALQAAKPLGQAAGGLANKYVAPVASDVVNKASSTAAGAVSQATGALKQQGVRQAGGF